MSSGASLGKRNEVLGSTRYAQKHALMPLIFHVGETG